jgi:hypothetical protein
MADMDIDKMIAEAIATVDEKTEEEKKEPTVIDA